MKHFFALLSICFFLHFNANAQRNFKPGYIVTLSGDTTKGFVDYKEWNRNPSEVTFKTTEQTASQQYSPNEIKAFGVNQFDHYQRYIGPVTTGAVDLADLGSGIDSSFVLEHVFLRIIAGSKNLTLYNYTDRIKKRYFISDQNSTPVELRRYVYLDSRQSNRTGEFNFYTQQLLALAIKYRPGNKDLVDQIQKTAYWEKDIEEVILKIDGSENQRKKLIAKRAGLSFFAGLSVNSFKTKVVEKDTYLGSAKAANTILPGVNFGVDIFFNKNVAKLIFRTEVGLSANNVSFDTKAVEVDYLNTYRRDDQLTFNQLTVSVTPQFIYNFYNKAAFKAYLAVGGQINFTSFSNYKHDVQESLNQISIGNNHTDKNYLRKTYPNAVIKAGIVLSKRFDIYATYNTRARLDNYAGKFYTYDIDSYRVGINYLFGKI